ncbi:hypothetical protein LIER_11948 [Lithospermum erythrorhizon]|uniref:Endonuclease/exonuclease/phosphatase domain-containing protein n=1 Tax=Lithospermum erythrorhizon TaxID=34254 RepID=A0AAV3PQ00_LITER
MLDVEADGRKGGLALLWNRKIDVSVKSFSSHHIEAVIEEGTVNSWRFVGFYGHHEAMKRKFSWELMRHIDSLSQLPTVFIGDFNEVLLASEHVSHRRARLTWQMNNFNQAVTDCGIFDIGCKGYPYPWSNNFIAPFSTRARLDRALAGRDWSNMFPNAELLHGSTYHSDHLSLFEESWCLYENSIEVVRESWNANREGNPGVIVFNGIRQCRLGLLRPNF